MTNEMTAEEAIRWLDAIKKYYIHGGDEAYDKKRMKAIDKAIQALEQQPCEDCISREAVIDHICEDKECYKEECKGRTLKRCPDLQWVFDLPPVTPQRPKGKWIKVITHKDDFGETWHFKCSICGEKSNKGYRPLENYCHNCGAEMSGGGETGRRG